MTTVVGPAVAAPAIADERDDSTSSSLATSPVYEQQTTPETNNTTDTLHENPDEVDDEDELDRLLSYLSGRMNTQIGTSTLRLSQGEYGAAKAALGNDYSDSLGKYVDVEGETDADGGSDQYESVQKTQREYVETVQEFRETRQEYREAKQAGDDTRARELARELTQLADEGDEQSNRLASAFGTISNRTGSDLSQSSTRIESVQANISEQRDEIAAAEFVDTTLTVRSATQNISFTDPLVLSGTLETENGTPVGPSTVSFEIGEQTIQTATEPNGSFTVSYRPTRIPANTSRLTVQYRPRNDSLYRTTSQTLPVSVTQVDATTQVSVPTDSAFGYADTVSVDGVVRVDGTPVENTSLLASLDGADLATARTNESGRVAFEGSVPASTSVGDVTLRVAPEHTDQAVRVTPASETVQITSEQTVVDATARVDDETIVVEGTLSTDEGDSVATQPLTVRVGGTTVETTTGVSGAYRTTVERPNEANTTNTTVTVAFDGQGTNLESSSTTASIQQSGADGSNENTSPDGLPFATMDLLWVIAGTGLVGFVTAVLLRRRNTETVGDERDAEQSTTSDDEAAVEQASSPVSMAALSSATDALSAGAPNDAVTIAYTAARTAVGATVDVEDSATHWEFYHHCADAGGVDAAALERLTVGYEKAAYSGRSVDAAEAETLVDIAAELAEASSDTRGSVHSENTNAAR
ncbi:DUF4129 domain-containing protein [Haloferax sp. YSMS24]|uniref:DUF4129 domain-containing protein n=1 Tax=Haloferax sp. YSMS24 TaxID=3388425 RepID=UPI00398D0790